MELEKQVCSLELAIKLKELGVKQESLFEWALCTKTEKYKIIGATGNYELNKGFTDYYCMGKDGRDGKGAFYSAFTPAELGEILNWFDIYLPYRDEEERGIRWNLRCVKSNYIWVTEFFYINQQKYLVRDVQNAKTEADARAKMLIYLKENNLI